MLSRRQHHHLLV